MDYFSSRGLLPAVGAGAVTVLLAWQFARSRNSVRNPGRLPLPPGPKPLPLIGNLRDMPTEKVWLHYHELAKRYGDLVFLEVFGVQILVVDDIEAVRDLLEKRSTRYSDRPRAIMLNELMGCGFQFPGMLYGKPWRARRGALHSYVNQSALEQWEPIQLEAVRSYLQRLLAAPDDTTVHSRHLFGKIIMKIMYNIDIAEKDDPYTAAAEKVIGYQCEASIPGAFLVDTIPALKHVPAWMPGAGFQRKAADCRHQNLEMMTRPFEATKAAIARGESGDCVVAQMFGKFPESDGVTDTETLIKEVVGISYAAGADTTVSALRSFFLAMVLHPDAQQKAQAELDAVVGSARLPTFADRPHLPYVGALISEVLRWQPVTPIAVPHAATTDDEYRGYFIPEKTIIIGNVWSILHNPRDYPEPEAFKPERFLRTTGDGRVEPDPDVQDPRVACFGFGRRVCPSRHLAEQSLFAVVASVLAVFSLTPVPGAVPRVEMLDGLVSHPAPFKCVIKPRSARAEELVRDHAFD